MINRECARAQTHVHRHAVHARGTYYYFSPSVWLRRLQFSGKGMLCVRRVVKNEPRDPEKRGAFETKSRSIASPSFGAFFAAKSLHYSNVSPTARFL